MLPRRRHRASQTDSLRLGEGGGGGRGILSMVLTAALIIFPEMRSDSLIIEREQLITNLQANKPNGCEGIMQPDPSSLSSVVIMTSSMPNPKQTNTCDNKIIIIL